MTSLEPNLIERVQRVAAQLTGTEQRLVAELMRAPREVALGTSAEFAARIGAHEATTSRLARKLGFDSYAAFRDRLRAEFIAPSAPAGRLSTTLSEVPDQGYLARLAADEITALGQLGDHVDDARIAAAAGLLDRERVFVFGHGNAEALVVLMERRLRRMGVAARALRGNARDLAEEALALGPADALLLFAFRRQPPGYAPLMATAREAESATVAISDSLGPTLMPAPDLLLSAPRSGRAEGFQTLTVPMTICNALVLALAARRGKPALDRLERLGELIARFSGS